MSTVRTRLTISLVVATSVLLGACSDDDSEPGNTTGTETTIDDEADSSETRPIDSAVAPDTASGSTDATGGSDNGP